MDQDTIDGGTWGAVVVDTIDGNGTPGGDIIDGNGAPTVQPDPEPPTPEPTYPAEIRAFWLESLDGSVVVPLSGEGRVLMPGATGLELPPRSVVTSSTPGLPGASLREVNYLERDVFLPLAFHSWESQSEFFGRLAELRSLLSSWGDVLGETGTFRLGVNSYDGHRLLDVVYKAGWEGTLGGSDSGRDWELVPLNLVAVSPFWRSREQISKHYAAVPGPAFLGTGDNSNPWPRRISSSRTIGTNMPIPVKGDVPVWPEFTFTGPIPSVSITYPGTNISIPGGVPDGSVLRLVTDPRAQSARLDGAIAWGRINMGATFSPLLPGTNRVSIALATDSADAGLDLSWYTQWESAW